MIPCPAWPGRRLQAVRLTRSLALTLVVIADLSLGAAPLAADGGAWVDAAPRLTVASSEMDRVSQPLTPASPVHGTVSRVVWRYRTPPGTRLVASLCHAQRCVGLTGPRGVTEALAGVSASGPLTFSFRLAEGQRPTVVEGMQVIVNHR